MKGDKVLHAALTAADCSNLTRTLEDKAMHAEGTRTVLAVSREWRRVGRSRSAPGPSLA